MENHIDAFKIDVAAAVTKSILLWRDATPAVKFPKPLELVKIELGRILGHRSVIHEVPAIRAYMTRPLLIQMADEPWDIDPSSLLRSFIAAVPNGPILEQAGAEMLRIAHVDATYGMLCRSGKPALATENDFTRLATQIAKILNMPHASAISIALKSRQSYDEMHSQISTRL
jgi:hypothetical protein